MSLTASVYERQIARARTLRHERIARGLCVQCGEPHQGPPQKCPRCTALASQAQWRWQQTHLKGRERVVRGWNFGTDDLIAEHVPLATRMARGLARRQFSSSTVDVDELVGDALYGLVVAGRTFDEGYGRPFHAWAALQIRSSMWRGIRSWCKRVQTRPVFVPLDVLDGKDGDD